MFVDQYRPSGAALRAMKIFADREDFERQVRLIEAAHGLAIPIVLGDDPPLSFFMPMAAPVVSEAMFFDVTRVLNLLWRRQGPSWRNCGREEYHTYVMSREFSTAVGPVARAFLDAAKALASTLYDPSVPITSDSFVHGDATISNFVYYNGVRIIDLSPRPSPPELELDLAKLLFSARGFDTTAARGASLEHWVRSTPAYRTSREALVRYYLATHVVRVLSKEPPATLERQQFFSEIINYASQP